MEQPRRLRADSEHIHVFRTRRLSADGDVLRVSAERGDIVPHPFQRGNLVLNRVIPGNMVRAFRRQFRAGQEAEDADTVVKGHIDDAFPRNGLAVVNVAGSSAGGIAAAVDEHHHRRVLRVSGGPYIQIEAVLRITFGSVDDELLRPHQEGSLFRLDRRSGILRTLPDPVPVCHRLGSLPAQFAHRRRGIGNPFINSDGSVVVQRSADGSACHGKFRTHRFASVDFLIHDSLFLNLARFLCLLLRCVSAAAAQGEQQDACQTQSQQTGKQSLFPVHTYPPVVVVDYECLSHTKLILPANPTSRSRRSHNGTFVLFQ